MIDKVFLQANRHTPSITWIGHSTFLIQTAGLNILTDPVWPSFIGLKKKGSNPRIILEEMPAIDVVLISHGQHLRLHFNTFRQLKGDPLYLVPDGMQDLFISRGLKNVKELSWWNHFVKIPLQFTFVPADHRTRRSLLDVHIGSSGGWICHNPKTKKHLYFAGDTSYFAGFSEIGARFPIDIAIIPVGPYRPRWRGQTDPLTLADPVQAFIDLQANTMIPMQYGTFPWSESETEVWSRLQAEWNSRGLDEERLKLLKQRETWRIDSNELHRRKPDAVMYSEL